MIPEALRDVVPTIGSVWMWEPLKPYAREAVRVTQVRWNGEAVWIETEPANGGVRAWNELDRWVEATVLVMPASDDN